MQLPSEDANRLLKLVARFRAEVEARRRLVALIDQRIQAYFTMHGERDYERQHRTDLG
jgi:hypothetical protein